MPLNFARRLTGRDRTARADQHLGFVLAFVAGAANAGGFLAVRQYTSHMTGIVSSMADELVLGDYALVLGGLGALLSFVAGAACSALMINFARRRQLHSEYALPLLVEAALLLGFGFLGAQLSQVRGLFIPATVTLLCFIMGLQNAVITKLSRAEIRTTHLTGMATDIGIEFGKMLYWNRTAHDGRGAVRADRTKVRLLTTLIAAFFVGGLAGAMGFKQVGYLATVPLALMLVAAAGVPAMDDLSSLKRSR